MQDLLTFMIISAVVRKLELEKRLNNSAKNNTPKNDELYVNDLEEELHRSKELIATIEKYFELTRLRKNMSIAEKILIEQRLGKQFHSSKK